jgi:hypothetical protein
MQRQQFLESRGLTVIRFNDADVKVDMNNVLMAIEGWIERNNPLTPFSKGELPTHFEKEPKIYDILANWFLPSEFMSFHLFCS